MSIGIHQSKSTDIDPRPWDRMREEGANAYAAFRIYLELGLTKRSLNLANEIYAKKRKEILASLGYQVDPSVADSSKSIVENPSGHGKLDGLAKKIREGKYKGFPRDWPSKYRWEDRASAYDRHMGHVRQRAAERAIKKNEKRRQALRRKADENFLVVSDALMYKALESLNGMRTIDFRPSDIGAMVRLAMEIKDRVLGQPEAALATPIDLIKNPIGATIRPEESSVRPIGVIEVRMPSSDKRIEDAVVIDV